MLWGLRPVKPQAAYNIALARLRRQIHIGLLLPDERLPAERKLAEDINIARVTLREALRVLEGNRYIVIRRGAQGGAFVESVEVLQQLSRAHLSRDRAGMMRLFEFREANEMAAVKLAAARVELPQLKRMRNAVSLIEKVTQPPELKQAESIFRLAIGEGCHNAHLAKAIEDGLDASFLPYFEDEFSSQRLQSEELHTLLLRSLEDADETAAMRALTMIFERDWTWLRSRHKAA